MFWTKSKGKKICACIWILFFRVDISDWLSVILQIAYSSTRLGSDFCAFTNLTLKAETIRLLHNLVHKLYAVLYISRIPKWKSLYLWNWSVFTALGHWRLLTVMPHLWQESTDFLITISLFAQHFSCIMCWTVILNDNVPDLQFRDILWIIQHVRNL